MEYICKFCGKLCLNNNSLAQHQIRCNKNPDKIRTKHSDDTIKKLSTIMSKVCNNSNRIYTDEKRKNMSNWSKNFNSTYWTDENREKHSQRMKKVVEDNPESYSTNNVSGRVKLYEYNGIKLKGTWEVKIVTLLDKFNIKWTNNIKPFPYYWNNSWHLYFPDFYLIDYDLFIEVKGYQRDRDIEKWKVLDNLLVIKKKEIYSFSKDENKFLDLIKKYKNIW